MLGYVLLASWQQIQLFRLLIMLDTSYHPGLIDTIKYAYMHIYTHACTHMHIHTYTFFSGMMIVTCCIYFVVLLILRSLG